MKEKKLSFAQQKSILKSLWKYLENYRMLIIGALILSVLIVVGTLYVPIVIGQVIDQLRPRMAVKTISGYLVRIGVIVAMTALGQ